jgi:hypothetical protein
LLNNTSKTESWHPCPGQLTGAGSYLYDFELDYNFELNYDRFRIGSVTATGIGKATGTTNASHLGIQLDVFTDGSLRSVGVTWLGARCPGDPI